MKALSARDALRDRRAFSLYDDAWKIANDVHEKPIRQSVLFVARHRHLRHFQAYGGEIFEKGFRAEGGIASRARERIAFAGKFFDEVRAERLDEKIENIAFRRIVRPGSFAFENISQGEAMFDLLEERAELGRVLGREASEGEHFNHAFVDTLAVFVQGVAGKGFLVFWRLRPEVIRPLADVFVYQRVDVLFHGPREPIAMRYFEVYVEHAIDERRRHGFHDSVILRAISGSDNYRAFGQFVFAYAPLVDKAIKCFLHFLAAGVEFIEKEAVRFIASDRNGRAETAFAFDDLRNADEIFRSELATEERNARKADGFREMLHECGFADAGRAPNKNGANDRDVLQKIEQLRLR